MTAAQKKSRERFKKAIAEAKKLRKKNPKLSQAQAVKQAWAILYSSNKVSGVKKKAAKKATVKKKAAVSKHKDTKSHNVNIKVVSGLPIGFTGKFLGWPFKVLNQYQIDGGVTAQIIELNPPGNLTAELNGRKQDIERAVSRIYANAKANWGNNYVDEKDLKKRITNFVTQLNKEVANYNSGKDTTTKKAKPIKYTSTVKKLSTVNQIKNILKNSKKRLKYGYTVIPGNVKFSKNEVISGLAKDSLDQLKKYTIQLKNINKERDILRPKKIFNTTDKKTKYKHLKDLSNSAILIKRKISELKKYV